MFLMPARIEVRGGSTLAATLLLDTGSDFNIVGLQIAQTISPKFESSKIERLANTGGGQMDTLGTMSLRWWCDDPRFPKRFESTDFHVAARTLDVDAIIGWRDIVRLNLISLNAHSFVGMFTDAMTTPANFTMSANSSLLSTQSTEIESYQIHGKRIHPR